MAASDRRHEEGPARAATAWAAVASLATGVAAWAQVPTLPHPRLLVDALGQAYDAAGYSTAVHGEVALIGARGADSGARNAGKVCAFRKGGNAWTRIATITEQVPVEDAEFGRSLALTSSFAFAAAASADGSGRVLAAAREGTSFGPMTPLSSPNRAPNDRFGERIAAAGAWLAVGAPGRAGRGAVDLFRFDGESWQFSTTLTPASQAAGQSFGRSVALSADTLAIGVPGDAASGTNSGAVAVFTLASGSWTAAAVLRAPDGSANDLFGASVAIDGAVLVAGANRDDVGVADSGSAYVFRRSVSGWTFAQKLSPENSVLDGDFGYSVAAAGGRVAVGAPGAVFGDLRRGVAYVFLDSGAGFAPVLKVGPSAAAGSSFAGTSVSLSAAGELVVGAPLDAAVASYAGGGTAVNLAADCDNDLQPDAIEVATGAPDQNADGVPDACQCLADFNGDGFVNGSDLGILLAFWGTGASSLPAVDMNRDGVVDGNDLGRMLAAWGPCAG